MKWIFFAPLFFLLSSCTVKSDLIGTYIRKYETLSLLKDSTFNYTYRFEQPSVMSFGIWSPIGKNKVLLKSRFDSNNLPVKVQETFGKEKNIRIIVVPEDSVRYGYIKSKIRLSYVIDSNEIIRNAGEDIVIPNDSIASIKVFFDFMPDERQHFPFLYTYEIKTITYHVKNHQANRFKLEVPVNLDVFFATKMDDVIELKGNKIFWENKGTPLFKKAKN